LYKTIKANGLFTEDNGLTKSILVSDWWILHITIFDAYDNSRFY